jgi:uncharacterized protein (DUF433 family)
LERKMLERITVDPKVCGGQACIRGIRIPVVTVLKMLASGMEAEEILREYPDLEMPDIRAALEYAAWLASEKTIPLVAAS